MQDHEQPDVFHMSATIWCTNADLYGFLKPQRICDISSSNPNCHWHGARQYENRIKKSLAIQPNTLQRHKQCNVELFDYYSTLDTDYRAWDFLGVQRYFRIFRKSRKKEEMIFQCYYVHDFISRNEISRLLLQFQFPRNRRKRRFPTF